MNKPHVSSVLFFLSLVLTTSFSLASRLSPTIYYIKTIDLDKDCSTKKTIYSVNGKALYKVCKESYNSCIIEGTCAVAKEDTTTTEQAAVVSEKIDLANTDSKIETTNIKIEKPSESTTTTQLDFEVINYVRSDKNGLPLFEAIDENTCPWGKGVQEICLDPFYTVAADLNYHRAGEVIYIPKLVGLKLPNGETHSGFMIVRDRGGAIKGTDRFDFYTGLLDYRDLRNPFTPVGFATSTNKFEYRKATPEEAVEFRKQRNFPKVPKGN